MDDQLPAASVVDDVPGAVDCVLLRSEMPALLPHVKMPGSVESLPQMPMPAVPEAE